MPARGRRTARQGHARRALGRGAALVPHRAGERPAQCRGLTGLARTCQHLVSNPWWGDPQAAAAASDLGREAVAIALSIAPGHADAHCVQGMLYSAAGQLQEAERAFNALAMDQALGIAHGFAGYNAAFLGRADETCRRSNARCASIADRRHSIWFFFGGFAELLLGRTETSIWLLNQSLERNPSYGSAQLFLAAALSTSGRDKEATEAAAKFRGLYPQHRTRAFEQLWLSRSGSAAYRAQNPPGIRENPRTRPYKLISLAPRFIGRRSATACATARAPSSGAPSSIGKPFCANCFSSVL